MSRFLTFQYAFLNAKERYKIKANDIGGVTGCLHVNGAVIQNIKIFVGITDLIVRMYSPREPFNSSIVTFKSST